MAALGQGELSPEGGVPFVDRKEQAEDGKVDGTQSGSRKGKQTGVGGCLPKMASIPAIQIRSKVVRGKIESWKEKALIRKFIGIWPKEKDLVKWINGLWNHKGHYNLQLGSKGFFTIIFFNQEDRDRILEGGPYVFFSTGLFLRPWKECFNLEMEDMTVALVWMRLFSLPGEY